jgi:predicted nucleic acid-binding protein
MGLILDSSVLINAERQGQNARQMLTAISRTAGNTDIAISVVTLIELAHGAARADTAQRKANRHQFIQELLTALPSSGHCANRSPRGADRRRESSERSAPSTRRSGVTALEIGYSVATGNLRHFQLIPGLSVTQF